MTETTSHHPLDPIAPASSLPNAAPILTPADEAYEIISLATKAHALGAEGMGLEASMQVAGIGDFRPALPEDQVDTHQRMKRRILEVYRCELRSHSRPEDRIQAALRRPWVPSVEMFKEPLRVSTPEEAEARRAVARRIANRAMGRQNFLPGMVEGSAERHHVWTMGRPIEGSEAAIVGLTTTLAAYEDAAGDVLRLRERRYALVGEAAFRQMSLTADMAYETMSPEERLARCVGELMTAPSAEMVAVNYFMARAAVPSRPMLRP